VPPIRIDVGDDEVLIGAFPLRRLDACVDGITPATPLKGAR
jgi:hypothetical protein